MPEEHLKMTSQRELILAELRRCGSHPTADELFELVKKKLPRISLATVYRNLEILSNAGLITKLETSGRQKRFDWDVIEHDHIFCIECHKVDNIQRLEKKNLKVSPQQGNGYKVVGCRVEFFGLCPACKKKRSKEKRTKGDKTMGCKSCGTLSDKARQVLEAMADCKEACASKDIAAATGLEPKQVSCQITALKKKGYVESPARCKYEISEEGKKALAS